MEVCNLCGKKIEKDLPFNCKYCNLIYCPNCRLPENHTCSGLKKGNRFIGKKYAEDNYDEPKEESIKNIEEDEPKLSRAPRPIIWMKLKNWFNRLFE
jgi:hypothetical protein